jgi:hypothetical protein
VSLPAHTRIGKERVGGRRPYEEELASLADGSLEAHRRPALAALVTLRPELAGRLPEQCRAVAALRAAAASAPAAPTALRELVLARRGGAPAGVSYAACGLSWRASWWRPR